MRRLARTALVALLFTSGCAHTKTTDDGSEKQHQKSEAKKAKPRATGAGTHETAGRGDEVPLATAPAGLLAPGADKKIHDRLVAEGFLADDAKASDAAMREGIRRFQRARDLPATGVPDDQTVKDLGLKPDDIFRRGTVKD